MKKNQFLTALFAISIFMSVFIMLKFAKTNEHKKESCNQPCPKTNQENDHLIMNSLNKFIVSL